MTEWTEEKARRLGNPRFWNNAERHRDDIWAALAEIQRQAREIKEWRRALQDLTPGGSEFQTPRECVEFVRQERADRMESIKLFKRRADDAAQRIAELELRLRVLCDEHVAIQDQTRQQAEAERDRQADEMRELRADLDGATAEASLLRADRDKAEAAAVNFAFKLAATEAERDRLREAGNAMAVWNEQVLPWEATKNWERALAAQGSEVKRG